MAVANTKSTAITNSDATPRVLNDPRISRGLLRTSVGTIEVAAADDDNSVYRFVRVLSHWTIHTILVANDAMTGSTAWDIGLYDTAANGGAVVSSQQQLFASAVDLSSAHAFTDYTYEATATNISQVEKKLWELMGLSADPVRAYDICGTATTVGSAAGTVSMRVNFTAGGG